MKVHTSHIAVFTVFHNLLKKHLVLNSPEEKLVVEALQRSSTKLENASLTDLAEYLDGLTPDQLKGTANNIKGIYNELRYVDAVNDRGDGIVAELFGATNHPGSDVIEIDEKTGKVIREVQLKASSNESYVEEHLSRYPDIDLVATQEVAEKIAEIESTGYTNASLDQDVSQQLEQLDNLDIASQIGDGAEVSALLAGSIRAVQVATGQSPLGEAGKELLKDIAVATTSTALIAFLFS